MPNNIIVNMTNSIGVNTALLFPGMAGRIFVSQIGAFGSSGFVQYEQGVGSMHGSTIYQLTFVGSGWNTTQGADISGIATSFDLAQSTDGGRTYTTLASVFLPVNVPIASVRGLTEDYLLNEINFSGFTFNGGNGNNTYVGSAGDDTFNVHGTGNNFIDGMGGHNTSTFTGTRANYTIFHTTNGQLIVHDNRAGAPDGTETMVHIQSLKFADTTRSTVPQTDFEGTLTSDLLLRDSATGALTAWEFQNGAFSQNDMFGGLGSNIQVAGTGDFNGDGTSDILLRDLSSGAVTVWSISHGHFDQSTLIGGMGSNIEILGTGDFYGTGTSDILLHDRTTGAISFWNIANDVFQGSTQLGGISGSTQFAGIGDFSGTGTDGVLLRDTSTGAVTVWNVANGQFQSSTQIGGLTSNLQIAGIGNFDGQGHSDVLLHDTNSGALSYWAVHSDAVALTTQIGGILASTQIAGVRDVTGNGFDDVLLRDASNSIGAFVVANGNFQSFISLGNVGGANVQVAG